MTMIPRTDILLNVVGANAPVNGQWYDYPHNDRDKYDVAIGLTAGTATWVLQGRNSPLDTPQQLDTGAASKMTEVPRFRQLRMILTAATGATFLATTATPGKQV